MTNTTIQVPYLLMIFFFVYQLCMGNISVTGGFFLSLGCMHVYKIDFSKRNFASFSQERFFQFTESLKSHSPHLMNTKRLKRIETKFTSV